MKVQEHWQWEALRRERSLARRARRASREIGGHGDEIALLVILALAVLLALAGAVLA